MKQGEFLSSDAVLTIQALAAQTGSHELRVYIPGTGVLICTFDATTGIAFALPNIFPELGTFRFDIIQPDSTFFDDGSGCFMWNEMLLHCGAESC